MSPVAVLACFANITASPQRILYVCSLKLLDVTEIVRCYCIQARTASPEPAQSQQPKTLSLTAPPIAVLGYAPTSSQTLSAAVPAPQPAGQSTINTSDAGQPADPAPSAHAQGKHAKDYGQQWKAQATQNAEAAAGPSAPAFQTGSPVAMSSFTDAAPMSTNHSVQGSQSAPSPSTAPPKQRSSLTDNLANQQQLLPAPLAAASPLTPQATPLATPSFALAAAAAAGRTITSGQTSAVPFNQQQQQPTRTTTHVTFSATPNVTVNEPVLANRLPKKAAGKGEQAASASSDGSGDTSENLYPFSTQRSAQDRLQGIVSSSSHPEEDTQGYYVFGRSPRTIADQNMFTRGSEALPGLSVGNHVGGAVADSQQVSNSSCIRYF